MNKNLIRKLLACVLALSVCLTYSAATALADETTGSVTTGDGSFSNPTVNTSQTSHAVTDPLTGNTTTTTEIKKNWKGTTENKAIEGEENTTLIDTANKYGTLSGSGSSKGKQTTTITDAPETSLLEVKGNEADNSGICTKADPITLTLTPTAGDVTANGTVHARFTPTDKIVPDWVGTITNGGTVTWKGTSSSNVGNVVINVTVSGKTDEAGTVTYTREDVSALSTVKYVYTYTLNADGDITAYTQETYTTVSVASQATTLPKYAEIFAVNGGTTAFELPEKPVVAEENKPVYGTEESNKDKIMSGQLVADILDSNGNVVGYMLITYQNGETVRYEAFMGSDVTTATSVESLAGGLRKYTTTKTTHTKTSGNTVSNYVSDVERTVTASMAVISDTSTADLSKGLTTYVPSPTNMNTAKDDSIDTTRDIRYPKNNAEATTYNNNGNYFQWLGEYGIESLIKIRPTDPVPSHMYEIKDKAGKTYYAYCADYYLSVRVGANYNLQRLEDVQYYKHNVNKSAENQVRAIALNGYWGTASGEGSLDAFKEKLTGSSQFTPEEVTAVTDGIALTATQCAIWYYASSSDSEVGPFDDSIEFAGIDDTAKLELVRKVYNYLINTDGNGLQGISADTGNTLLTEKDFAQEITLTIKEKVGDNYNTSVSVTMPKVSTEYADKLALYISGEEVAKLSDATYDTTLQAYTIDVILPADADITLSLKGTQAIDNGVYLFICGDGVDNPAQTFIAAGSTTQEVNFSTSFKFSVSDPIFTLTSTDETSSAETLAWDGSCSTRVYYYSTGIIDHEGDEQNDGDDENSSYTFSDMGEIDSYRVSSGSVTSDSVHAEADVPKTGDANRNPLIWFALVGGSAAALLALLQRKRKQNAK